MERDRPMSLAGGARLGPYEIQSLLGAGGMGEVYRARDTRLDRIVAIKVLPAHLASHPELRQRMEREARAVSSLNHPHICALYDIGSQDGVDFLVLEFLEGETLAARLERGPLSLDDLLRLATQIADALDRAHRQGVAHRDLKPGNIMLTKAGAKLLDFGLAKVGGGSRVLGVGDPTLSQALTQKGTILGTIQYMAPEQLEGREADWRSDLFAFGAVLYEMATGRKAFGGQTQASVIGAILHTEPPPLRDRVPASPASLDRVIRSCLAKDPDLRWQSAHDLKNQLQWILEAAPEAAPVAAAPSRRSRAWIAIAAALLVAALGLAAAYWRHLLHFANTVTYWRAAWRRLSACRVGTPADAGAAPCAEMSLGAADTSVCATSANLRHSNSEMVNLGVDADAVQVTRFLVPAPERNNLGAISLSPDGRRLAYVGFPPAGERKLWIRPLDSTVAQPLPAAEGGASPFWSPDGRFVAFFPQGKLKKADLSGGPAQTICDSVGNAGGSWSTAGVIVFSNGGREGLYQVPAAGGAPKPATRLDASRQEIAHRRPYFLPDGRHFIYYAGSRKSEDSALWVASLDSQERKLLAPSPEETVVAYVPPQNGVRGHLLFARDNTLMEPRGTLRPLLEGGCRNRRRRAASKDPEFQGCHRLDLGWTLPGGDRGQPQEPRRPLRPVAAAA